MSNISSNIAVFCPLVHLQFFGWPKTSCPGSSLVKRAAFTATSQRLNSRLCSGRARSLQGRRRSITLGAKPRACWWFPFTFMGLCTWDLSTGVSLLTPSTTVTFWGVWGRTFGTTGNRAHQHDNTPPYSALETYEFLLRNIQLSLPTPLLVRFGSLRLLPVPQNEVCSLVCSRRSRFQVHSEIADVHAPMVTKTNSGAADDRTMSLGILGAQ